MKFKRNIRPEINYVFALVGLLFLVSFVERKQGAVLCKNIYVELENITENQFYYENDILNMLDKKGKSIRGLNISQIDLNFFEEKLLYDKHIKDAQLYADLNGNVIVRVKLRRPIARIVQHDGPDAYISEDGVIMDVSDKFISRCLIIEGQNLKPYLEAGSLVSDEEGKKLLDMLLFIQDDKFWKAQVAQLEINRSGYIVLYPQITKQIVEFGKVDNYDEKFKKLKVFYKKILPVKGWSKYYRVNLEYEKQIIAE